MTYCTKCDISAFTYYRPRFTEDVIREESEPPITEIEKPPRKNRATVFAASGPDKPFVRR
jgi:hypothetical protein